MDYQEAIGIFENEIKKLNTQPIHVNHIGDAEKAENAMKTAISAMNELHELHEQGINLESLKDIDFRKEIIEHINYETYMSVKCELEDYQQLGTLYEVKEAVEKQKEKKIEIWNGQASCPNCGNLYGNMNDIKKLIAWVMPYCKYCGQKLDWSGENECKDMAKIGKR